VDTLTLFGRRESGHIIIIPIHKKVRFQVFTGTSMKMFRAVFWVVLPCKMIVDLVLPCKMIVDRTTQKTALNIILAAVRT
jgi:hypothetical protein